MIMRTQSKLLLATTLAISYPALTGGCAEERGPINRVQSGALEKAFFIGKDFESVDDDPEFWSQNTIIDVGWGASQGGLFTSSYVHPTSRLRWQVTEDMLFARAAYERVEDSDGKGLATGLESQDGIIVAAFRIEGHFDIAYEYNPATGEELNVIVENATDRPWYERAFIRVDWSTNYNTNSYDFDTLSILGMLHGVDYEPLSYHVEDPNSEQAPFFDTETGYFDVTTKVFATPRTVDISHLGWGFESLPACFLNFDTFGGSYPEGSCSPAELTVRHAFRRVENHDYAPMDWDGWRFQAFGGFTIDRFGYARNYGMTDDRQHRFLTRYPIWERHHYYDNGEAQTGPVECYTSGLSPATAANANADAEGDAGAVGTSGKLTVHNDADGDGTEDACATVTELTGLGGSKCNEFTQKCTLPLRARTPKTIAWYFVDGAENRFYDATEDAAHQWDVALRTAVRAGQYAECVRTGGVADDCKTAHPMYFGQQTENDDAIELAREMDDCRRGKTFAEHTGDAAACGAAIDEIAERRGYSAGVRAIAKMDEMIVLCHSPVEADDPPACAPAIERLPADVTAEACAHARAEGDRALLDTCRKARTVRRGDLRYHQVNTINTPQTPSPWGIYTDAEDPLTGESIAASINVYTWFTDYWAQRLVDTMRFASGELSDAQVTEGEHIHNWSKAAEAAANGRATPTMTRLQVQTRLSEFAAQGSRSLDRNLDAKMDAIRALPTRSRNVIRGQVSGFTGVMASAKAAGTSSATYSARRQHAKNTAFEAELMTPMMQEYSGLQSVPLDSKVMDMASPIRAGNPSFRHQLDNLKRVMLANHGMCEVSAAGAPVSIKGLADALQQKFGAFSLEDDPGTQSERADRMVRYLAGRVHRSVVQHEMGHSVGLRHNFMGSADAFSYRPQYWQLRTKDGTVKARCTNLSPDGEGCVGPRYYDPPTTAENENLIWMWEHSSVMDYAGDAAQELLGLGAYDFAATRMFYGDTVSVLAAERFKPGPLAPEFTQPPYEWAVGNSILEKLDNFGGIVGLRFSNGIADFQHYSQIGDFYGLLEDCKEVNAADFVPTGYDEASQGKWSALLDGGIVSPNGKTTRCRQPQVDYVPWTSLGTAETLDDNLYYRSRNAQGVSRQVDSQNRPRVPYGFASDDWADLGNVSVNLFDNGADAYEIFNFLIAQQELFHIFDNYRRGRSWFSVRGAADHILNQYSIKLRNGAKGLALQRNYIKSFFTEIGWNFDEVWLPYSALYFDDNILASAMVFDHFARNFARPQIGLHCMPHFEGVMRSALDSAGCDEDVVTMLNVPNGAYGTAFGDYALGGKLVENQLDTSQGEYEVQYRLNSGSYYDKAYTAMLMTESVDNFISSVRTDFIDKRYRAVSLADLYPEGYRRWLANNLTGDDEIKGAHLGADPASGRPRVGSDFFPVGGMGWTSWWGEEPTACFPQNGTNVCAHYSFDYSKLSLARDDLNDSPESLAALDPQVGWEQQKFLIAWTLLYLPENEKQQWLNMLRIWELGRDADPGIDARIEFHDPNGRTFVARTYGTEEIFGKTVQRGIAARILEYANELLVKAYETTEVDYDEDGEADWYLVVRDEQGHPKVLFDATMTTPLPFDIGLSEHVTPGCTAEDNSGCTCVANRYCSELEQYIQVPFYLRQALDAYGLADPELSSLDGS